MWLYGFALCDIYLCKFKVHALRPRSNCEKDCPCAICKRDLDNCTTSLHIIMSSCTPSMGTACLTPHAHPWERPCAICKRDLDNCTTSLHIIMSSCTPSMGTACLTPHAHPWERPCAICKRDLDNRATLLHIIMSSCIPSMGIACLTPHAHPWEPRTSTSMGTLRCIMRL